jgi:hypothetical protein
VKTAELFAQLVFVRNTEAYTVVAQMPPASARQRAATIAHIDLLIESVGH